MGCRKLFILSITAGALLLASAVVMQMAQALTRQRTLVSHETLIVGMTSLDIATIIALFGTAVTLTLA